MCEGKRLQLETDSKSASLGLQSGYSSLEHPMTLIRSCRITCASLHITFRVRHIMGDHFNQIADALSHDQGDLAAEVAWRELGFQLVLRC